MFCFNKQETLHILMLQLLRIGRRRPPPRPVSWGLYQSQSRGWEFGARPLAKFPRRDNIQVQCQGSVACLPFWGMKDSPSPSQVLLRFKCNLCQRKSSCSQTGSSRILFSKNLHRTDAQDGLCFCLAPPPPLASSLIQSKLTFEHISVIFRLRKGD